MSALVQFEVLRNKRTNAVAIAINGDVAVTSGMHLTTTEENELSLLLGEEVVGRFAHLPNWAIMKAKEDRGLLIIRSGASGIIDDMFLVLK